MQSKQRCKWCNLKNEKYIKYHDEEWGILNLNEQYLFEMLILESFQAGLLIFHLIILKLFYLFQKIFVLLKNFLYIRESFHILFESL